MIDKLIINADDFYLTENINKGIIKCMNDGIVTSTTALMNSYTKNYNINMGVHLNVTLGAPLTNGKSFIKDNRFKKVNEHTIIDEKELYDEWKTQIDLFIKHYNCKPTHIDSHHHMHLKYPNVTLKLANEYQLPVRDMKTDFEEVTFIKYNPSLCSLSDFKKICEENTGIIEIMTHPGFNDNLLESISSFNKEREIELNFWISKDIKQYILDNHIKLISYKDIKITK